MKAKQLSPEMIAEARKLYVKYGGRQIIRIEREMRERGWPFRRRLLYSTRHSHGVTVGWPERFGWRSLLTPDQIAGLGQRNRGRNRFEHWLGDTFPEWTWTWKYQRYIYKRLAAVTSGGTRRLMIFMPPRHGKSEMVTVRYTAWRLLQNPRLNVILGSYNQKLADKFSRKIKRIIQSAAYAGNAGALACTAAQAAGSVAPAPARPNAPSPRLLATASEWETPGGGVVRSAGVGSGIAGFGAGLIVIDDPVRNRADAESKTYRDRVWEWFNDDIYTRMEPDASIILIQTRWHEDDLAGRLLREMHDGGEKWDVISLPALAVPGNAGVGAAIPQSAFRNPQSSDPLGRRPGAALCPQRYPVKTLLRYKKKLGSYSFSALYQQNPAPAEGGTFKRAWFKNIIDQAPEGLRWKRGWDLAVSMKTSADCTASFRCAKDKLGNLYIADGFRKRIEYPDQRRIIIERMRSEPNTEHGIEAALHGPALIQDLRRDWRMGRFAFRQVQVRGDKLTRALAWLNLAEEGRVFLVRGPWIDDFIDEICRFPTGSHDDQIDAVSLAVQMLTTADRRLYVF